MLPRQVKAGCVAVAPLCAEWNLRYELMFTESSSLNTFNSRLTRRRNISRQQRLLYILFFFSPSILFNEAQWKPGQIYIKVKLKHKKEMFCNRGDAKQSWTYQIYHVDNITKILESGRWCWARLRLWTSSDDTRKHTKHKQMQIASSPIWLHVRKNFKYRKRKRSLFFCKCFLLAALF